MGAAVAEAATSDKGAKPRLPSWLRAIAIVAAGLLIAAAIWVTYSSELVVGDANHRNFHELEVAANGLEAWPNSLLGLAKANFIAPNIEKASAKDRAEGWIGVAHIYHPEIGPYNLLYQVASPKKPGVNDTAGFDPCAGVRNRVEAIEGMRLPFIEGNRAGDGPQLKVIGALPVKTLWIANHVENTALPPDNKQVDLDDVFAKQKLGPKPVFGSVLCYAAVVPIAKLLAFDRTGQQFTDLLIVDGDRRVVRQLGSRPIAVDTLDKLAPAGSTLDAAFAQATDKDAGPADPPPRLADALKPVTLEITGESYLAFVREFHLPPGVKGCESEAKTKSSLSLSLAVGEATVDRNAPVKRTAAADKTETVNAPPPAACFLVGLMPNRSLMRSALTLSPLPLVTFGLIAALALALLPTARLLLIGTGDALPGYAAAGVVLGIPMAAGCAALALLFACDIVRERAGAHDQAVAVARTMSVQISRNLRDAIKEATDDARKLAGSLDPGGDMNDPVDPEPKVSVASNRVTPPLPVIEAIAAIGKRGGILGCHAKTFQFRNGSASWPNVGGRDYFTRIRDGETDGSLDQIRYVVAQVRSQTDGINKTIIALDPHSLGIPAVTASMAKPEDCTAAVIVASTVLPSLLAPVLPEPLGFMVVDSRNPDSARFPVIFHDQPEHAGAENLGTELDAPALRHLRDWLWSTRRPATISDARAVTTFTGRYEGADRRFVAARIAGTSWVLLVNYALDDVDAVAAATAGRAIEAWLAVSFFLVCAWAIIIWIGGRRGDGWRSLWPHEPTDSMTRGYQGLIAVLAAGFVAVELAILHLDFGAWTSVPGVAVTIAAGFYIPYRMRLGGLRPVTALTPRTERLYRWMVVAFVGCAIIVPVHGFWQDARRLVVAQAEQRSFAELTAPGGSIDRRNTAVAWIQRAFQLDCTRQQGGFCERLDSENGRFIPVNSSPADASEPVGGLSATLWDWGGGVSVVAPARCSELAASKVDTQCSSSDNTGDGLVRHIVKLFPDDGDSVLGLTLVVSAMVGFCLCFWWLISAVLKALCGFGIPLEGVTRPSLFLGTGAPPKGSVRLPARALIVGPPDELRAQFVGAGGRGVTGEIGGRQVDWTAVDLATRVAALPITCPPKTTTAIVVYGLEVIIRDTDRRHRALEQLEQLDKRVGRDSYLVVMSVLSPLERILDAYEQDRGEPTVDVALAKYREQFRWSRVFERFTTFSFAPVEHVDRTYLDTKEVLATLRILPPDQVRAIRCLFDETRWLPVPVIESVVGEPVAMPPDATGKYPIEPGNYQQALSPRVLNWAIRLQAASPQAAIDYLRGAVIEHYQKCWSASTHAERVVLDRLAHGTFVNVARTVIPLSSLVRRGLVVFDPAPQLMNQSFAMFVRQAERPERIEFWRRQQPAGAWAVARLPILVAVPSLVMLLFVSILWSGQDVTTLLPLLATGAPALLATLSRSTRRSTD